MSRPDQINSTLVGSRQPLFIGSDFERLKAERYTVRRARLLRLLEECERGRATRFSSDPPHESTTWAGIGIMNRALLYLLTDDPNDLKEAERWIDGAITWA